MNIVIIEDERLVADDLEKNIRKLLGPTTIIKQIHSVSDGIAYFNSSLPPDLIISDIQLGDGLSFEILAGLSRPVPTIFCTAYDEYALDAFKVNGIDYILKPFTASMLQQALNKYSQLKQLFLADQSQQYQVMMQMLTDRPAAKAASVIVYHQDKIIPISMEEIALFVLEGEVIKLITHGGKTYYPNKPLDELERITGGQFFRANRQYLISRKAIIDVASSFSRKLQLNLTLALKDKVIVSKAKAPVFLEWLSKTG